MGSSASVSCLPSPTLFILVLDYERFKLWNCCWRARCHLLPQKPDAECCAGRLLLWNRVSEHENNLWNVSPCGHISLLTSELGPLWNLTGEWQIKYVHRYDLDLLKNLSFSFSQSRFRGGRWFSRLFPVPLNGTWWKLLLLRMPLALPVGNLR